MFNPYSGKRLENLLFIGPIYYQRLRHLVDDKMYARQRGPVVAITRQPTHGRSRAGGLRFGEMERDCIISHGISNFLRERLFLVSDQFRIHVCARCGLMAVANLTKNAYNCTYCGKVYILLFRQQRFIKWTSPTRLSSCFKSWWRCTLYQNCTSLPKRTLFDLMLNWIIHITYQSLTQSLIQVISTHLAWLSAHVQKSAFFAVDLHIAIVEFRWLSWSCASHW